MKNDEKQARAEISFKKGPGFFLFPSFFFLLFHTTLTIDMRLIKRIIHYKSQATGINQQLQGI